MSNSESIYTTMGWGNNCRLCEEACIIYWCPNIGDLLQVQKKRKGKKRNESRDDDEDEGQGEEERQGKRLPVLPLHLPLICIISIFSAHSSSQPK